MTGRTRGATPAISAAMKKLLGVVSLLMGLGIGGWIAYNYLVEMQPAARGRNPLLPIAMSTLFVYQGWRWLREG